MLSDSAIRKAKPADKQYKLTDERGLHLLVRPSGSKLWQLRYRHQGKEKTASLGQYPDVSLAQAREKRDTLRRELAAGNDPVEVYQARKQAQVVDKLRTFEVVARDWWLQWQTSRSDSHVDYVT